MQDDALFAGTMAENVSFFDADLDMERVYRVARLARIHDDVMAMPLKYDTLVGDMGSTLSGGQKQRVLLARALYHDPQVLFIDEGTAHLDPEVERSIAEVLANLPVTRIMIAHRPQALLGADRLFHVEAGCIRQIASQESSRSSLEDCVAA
jgi:ATP-binding cassette subfamily B protein RaxB